jgi:hypothetical protein
MPIYLHGHGADGPRGLRTSPAMQACHENLKATTGRPLRRGYLYGRPIHTDDTAAAAACVRCVPMRSLLCALPLGRTPQGKPCLILVLLPSQASNIGPFFFGSSNQNLPLNPTYP